VFKEIYNNVFINLELKNPNNILKYDAAIKLLDVQKFTKINQQVKSSKSGSVSFGATIAKQPSGSLNATGTMGKERNEEIEYSEMQETTD